MVRLPARGGAVTDISISVGGLVNSGSSIECVVSSGYRLYVLHLFSIGVRFRPLDLAATAGGGLNFRIPCSFHAVVVHTDVRGLS